MIIFLEFSDHEGFIQTFNKKQKHNKFKRSKLVLDNIGKPEKWKIFYQ